MSSADEIRDDVAAVRTGVTVSAGDHLACVRVDGPGAHELLDRVSPRQLFVRSGQMLHTLLLGDDARPLADVYLCCDDDGYMIVAEGMTGAQVAGYLEPHRAGVDASVTDLTPTHAFVCLDGPYSWELVADVTTPDVIGLPYLGFFRDGELTCFRGGKTGEFGYDLLVARDRVPALRDRLAHAGARFALREIGRAAIEACMLEAGFFNPRSESRDGLTPVELQLQWRTTAGRTFPGSVAMAARRASATRRTVLVASETPFTEAPVSLDGRDVGVVLHAGWSPTRGEQLGVALVDRAVAHPGLEGFACAGAALRSISAPAVNNRSWYIDPQRHTFATRHDAKFLPLVRPRWS